MRVEGAKIAVCRNLDVDGNCGTCGIHGSTNYPPACKEFYCGPARKRMSFGKDPCKGCTVAKMLDQGCCTNDLGFGTKLVQIDDDRDNENLAAPNPLLDRMADLFLRSANKKKR